MPILHEQYAGTTTKWIGQDGARVRYLDRSPGLVVIEKGGGSVTITEEEARTLGWVLTNPK
jgi:hypothetical protein